MIHELFPDNYNSRFDRLTRHQKKRCVEYSHAIICISESTKNDLEDFYGSQAKKISIVPPAYNTVFRRLYGKFDIDGNLIDVPFLLFVGNRTYHKNFMQLIEAYRIWDDRDKVLLVVVGPPWTSEEKDRLEIIGIMERIILFTNINDETLCKFYNLALAFVYPSIYEGFGIPLLEAMACG